MSGGTICSSEHSELLFLLRKQPFPGHRRACIFWIARDGVRQASLKRARFRSRTESPCSPREAALLPSLCRNATQLVRLNSNIQRRVGLRAFSRRLSQSRQRVRPGVIFREEGRSSEAPASSQSSGLGKCDDQDGRLRRRAHTLQDRSGRNFRRRDLRQHQGQPLPQETEGRQKDACSSTQETSSFCLLEKRPPCSFRAKSSSGRYLAETSTYCA